MHAFQPDSAAVDVSPDELELAAAWQAFAELASSLGEPSSAADLAERVRGQIRRQRFLRVSAWGAVAASLIIAAWAPWRDAATPIAAHPAAQTNEHSSPAVRVAKIAPAPTARQARAAITSAELGWNDRLEPQMKAMRRLLAKRPVAQAESLPSAANVRGQLKSFARRLADETL
jgi:hypothetical protein